MARERNTEMHFWAVRMNWLRWLARPIVAIWNFLVFIGGYLWNVTKMVWKALRTSFNYRYWFLAAIGGCASAFFVVSFCFISTRLNIPLLALIGVVVGILPIGWSFAEISSLLRRKVATGSEFTLSEIRFQLGSGFKAVRKLMKYVTLVVIFLILQVLLSFLAKVPGVGSLLYTIAIVPVVLFSILSLACLLLLLFGLAVFPSHVLYQNSSIHAGFFTRNFHEIATLLAVTRKNVLKILTSQIPASFFYAVLIGFPALVLGSAFSLSMYITQQVSSSVSIYQIVRTEFLKLGPLLAQSSWGFVGALRIVFLSISLALLAGIALAMFFSFCASLFFHIYVGTLVERKKKHAQEEDLLAEDNDEVSLYGGQDSAFIIADLDTDQLFEDGDQPKSGMAGGSLVAGVHTDDSWFEDKASAPEDESITLQDIGVSSGDDISGDDILASIESTMPIAEEPVEKQGVSLDEDEEDESITLEDIGMKSGDDISGDDILASIESTMPIAEEPVEKQGVSLDEDEEDDSITLEDIGMKSGDDISGDDILASIESTMPIAEEPVEKQGVSLDEDEEDESITLEDIGMKSGDDISGDDILASIESTMPIAEEPVEQQGVSVEEESSLVAPDAEADEDDISGDDILASIESTMPIAETPQSNGSVTNGAELDDLLGDMDSVFSEPATAAVDSEASSSAALEGDAAQGIDDLLADMGDEVQTSASDDPLAGLDDDNIDDLLGGDEPVAAPVAEEPAAEPVSDDPLAGLDEDNIDDLLGGEEPAATPLAEESVAESVSDDPLAGLDDNIDDLLGGDEPVAAPVAEEPVAESVSDDPLAGLDDNIDDLLGGDEPVAAPLAEEPVAESVSDDPLAGLDDDNIDALLGGDEPAAAPVAEEPAAEPVSDDPLAGLGDDNIDDLLGGDEPVAAQVAEAPAAEPVSDDPLAGLGDDNIGALLGDEAPAAEPISDDPLAGLGDDNIDDLLGGDEPVAAPVAEEPVAESVSDDPLAGLDDDNIDALLGGDEPVVAPVAEEPAAEPVSDDPLAGLDDDNIGALLGGDEPVAGPVAEEPAAEPVSDDPLAGLGDDNIDALLGDEEPVAAQEPAAPVVESAIPAEISKRGTVAGLTYLASVKGENQLYFGVRGAAGEQTADPFQLNLTFEGGQEQQESVAIGALNEKGMGYAKIDFSQYLTTEGFGRIADIEVIS